MRLSRGLALMLIAAGVLFGAVAPWLSVSHGPAKSSFEAVRRFDTALAHGQTRDASQIGLTALALAENDARWSAADLARLEHRVALTLRATGRDDAALRLSRAASAKLAAAPGADLSLVIDAGIAHGDLALSAGEKLESVCIYGLLLERLGSDRVARPEARLRPDPALAPLTEHLSALGPAFRSAPEKKPQATAWPATSCNLLAGFYATRRDFASAKSVSDTVIAHADTDPSLGPEMRAALLQNAAHIAELNGDLKAARAQLERAVEILPGDANKQARAVALEALAGFLANWSDAKAAMPLLHQSIALRESLDGKTGVGLVSPLLALGYAQMDTGDPSAAEASFDRALSIAQGEHSRNPSAALEAMLALTELYETQDRSADAQRMKAESTALQNAGIALRPDVEDVPIEQPTSSVRLALFSIPYSANPHGLAAGTPSAGTIDVAIAAPNGATWAKAYEVGTFVNASEATAQPLVYAPSAAKVAPPTPSLVFVPGQGTNFTANAARLARLQALLGPSQKTLLVNWSGASPDGLRDPASESRGRRGLSAAIAMLGQDGATPLTLVAEGRSAQLLYEQMARADAANRARIEARLTHLILLAPEMEDTTLVTWVESARRNGTRVTIYSARTARPLLIARDVYDAKPIGLEPERIATIRNAEAIEIGISSDWLDFDALFSDALVSDIADAINTGASPDKRCTLAQSPGNPTLYVLSGKACANS